MTLFFFTETYPYGLGESWKTNELNVFSRHFEKIYVCPLRKDGAPKNVIPECNNIEVLEPVFKEPYYLTKRDLFLMFNPIALKEIFSIKFTTFKTHIRELLSFVKRAKYIKASKVYNEVSHFKSDDIIWYFFWARGWSDVLPFINIPKGVKVFVRLHGYDLYLERNNGYIPFRKNIFQKANVLLPVSIKGKKYLEQVFKVNSDHLIVSRLGSKHICNATVSVDNKFRIVSCSGIVPVKRIDRLVRALCRIDDIEIIWTHIGGGVLRNDIEALSKSLPSNIERVFIGEIPAENVLKYYCDNPVDVFINTSESEGVPVAIMEAMSAGIPIIATDVGGTSEIVDATVGILLSEYANDSEIAAQIRYFYKLPIQRKEELRNTAFQKYMTLCNAEVNAVKLVKIFKNDIDR